MSVSMPPAVLLPDTLRSLVAVGADGEVAVALRDLLPREMVVVLDVRAGEADAAVAACRPYPWMVVDATPEGWPRSARVVEQPTILLARKAAAAAPHALTWSRFGDLAATVGRMLTASLGGMRLAPGVGVELEDGDLVRSAALQALISLHPRGFALPAAQFRSAARILAAHGSAWRPGYDHAAGGVVLAAAP